MKWRGPAVFLLLFFCQVALADTLVLKSGENKKGKILEEGETKILFDSQKDGMVIEVPRSNISIVDRDEGLKQKGFLQTFSTSPKNKKIKKNFWGGEDEEEKQSKTIFSESGVEAKPMFNVESSADHGFSFDSIEKMIDHWLQDHPETNKLIQEWKARFKDQSEDLEKMVRVAKEANA